MPWQWWWWWHRQPTTLIALVTLLGLELKHMLQQNIIAVGHGFELYQPKPRRKPATGRAKAKGVAVGDVLPQVIGQAFEPRQYKWAVEALLHVIESPPRDRLAYIHRLW